MKISDEELTRSAQHAGNTWRMYFLEVLDRMPLSDEHKKELTDGVLEVISAHTQAAKTELIYQIENPPIEENEVRADSEDPKAAEPTEPKTDEQPGV